MPPHSLNRSVRVLPITEYNDKNLHLLLSINKTVPSVSAIKDYISCIFLVKGQA